ncbi:MAG: ABC transporter permease [Flavobacteriales bacterium]|nr:ABC transporter permease [Flavobacteriales bacterium]MBK6945663.1 ABC transporter permease [Flavobacteriales bacterium]MBK7241767.1 ABC transporter permease [Flavobacteriales bacterium]MBK7296230.1 ABC transporter permease [Flavobacteriales bacterium]MBK9534785.1 ABC transporter permease [Flavobacteriales bacterium]
MFDRDKWQEIFDTMSKNKLRTVLTGFSVFWGIAVLVLLLGLAAGLGNGFSYNFRNTAMNSISIWGGETSKIYKGLPPNREIQLDMGDIRALKNIVPGVIDVSGEFRLWRGRSQLNYGKNYGNFTIKGIQPNYQALERQVVTSGRFINEVDQNETRKVIVMAQDAVEALFKKEDPIHKWVQVNGIPFEVVGIYKFESEGRGGNNQSSSVFIPLSAAQKVFHADDKVDRIVFSFADASELGSKQAESRAIAVLSGRHQFDPKDDRALYIDNNVENLSMFNEIFGGINWFTIFIGLGTIIAGIVGVSNIMLIVVKDRTREIGIRKALGATPMNVISQVIMEAIFVTGVFGFFGLFFGFMLIEGLATAIPGSEMFRDPEVKLSVAVGALLLLVLAGAIAGWIPARIAANVRPIEALRDE